MTISSRIVASDFSQIKHYLNIKHHRKNSYLNQIEANILIKRKQNAFCESCVIPRAVNKKKLSQKRKLKKCLTIRIRESGRFFCSCKRTRKVDNGEEIESVFQNGSSEMCKLDVQCDESRSVVAKPTKNKLKALVK